MSNLYDYLINDEPIQGYISNNIQETDPHQDEAIAIDMFTPSLEFAFGLKGLFGGIRTFNGIKPYLSDIWQGRNLLFGNNTKSVGKKLKRDIK